MIMAVTFEQTITHTSTFHRNCKNLVPNNISTSPSTSVTYALSLGAVNAPFPYDGPQGETRPMLITWKPSSSSKYASHCALMEAVSGGKPTEN